MKRKQSTLNILSTAITLVLMGVAWFLFAPTEFGGQAAYVIISGNSMEPLFHQDDLVILHRAEIYQVGDIVTYRHPELGPVIHRIVAQEGDHYIFKGDHNTWTDGYHPTRSEFIGKFWLHLPSLGQFIKPLHTPWAMAFLAAGLTVVGLLSLTGHQVQKAHRRNRIGGQRSVARPATKYNVQTFNVQTLFSEEHHVMNYLRESKTDLFFVLLTLALAALLLAFFAFSQPVTQTITDQISYQQRGEFSYSADAPPGIYEADNAQTGQPIFRQLITKVKVNFDYHFTANWPSELQGSYRLIARLRHANGWQWTLELQPATTFSGDTFSAGSQLDLAQIQALIAGVEQQTGLQHQPYTLDLIPEVNVTGQLAGQEVSDQFAPRLSFQLDELQLRLAQDISQVSDTQNPLKPVTTGVVSRTREAPNTLALLSFQLKVSTARQLALGGLVLSLGGLLALGWSMLRATQGDEAARIRSKYGSLIITVSDPDLEMGRRLIQVAAIDDLARLAERDGRMILHQDDGSTQRYLVLDEMATYYYQPAVNQGKILLPVKKGVK